MTDEPRNGDAPLASPILRAPPPRPKRPLWRTLLWVLAIVVVAGLVGYLLTPRTPAAGAGGPAGAGGGGRHGGAGGGRGGRSGRPPTVVGVATAATGDIPIQINALGAVTPQASVTVHTRIAGTLMAVYFTEGQSVRQGQLLALVDPRPYQVALEQAQGQLLHDQALLDNARIDLNRYKTLAAQDSIAHQQVDTQAALVKQDQGTVVADKAAVDNAKLNLVYCHITAPVSGRVGLRQVDAGNFVQTGDTNGVVVINQVDPITVVFTVPEDDIPQINAHTSPGHGLPVTAFDRTGTTTLGQGELMTLDNQIDPTTGMVKAKAKFANPRGMLFPSQFVNVTMLVDTLKNAVTIPAVAVRHGPNGDFVYVIQEGSTVKMTNVKVGPAQGETTSIASGLAVGDRVVTDGGDRLSDGSKVVLPEDAAKMAGHNRQPKPTGFFGWLQGLFGKKPAPDQAAAGGGSGGSDSGSGGAGAGGGHGGGRMQAMLAGLGLTPDQDAKVKQILADARTKAQGSDDPDARRTAMQDARTQIEAILTPAQKAKFAQERAEQASGGGGGSGAPQQVPATPPPTTSSAPVVSSIGPAKSTPKPTASAAPSGAPSSGGSHWGGGQGGGGGDRLARLTEQLGLDAGQQAKAKAIFDAARAKAEGSSDPDARHTAMREAMGQLEAILRPDQKAKFEAARAARESGGGGSGGSQ
jgi:multidrug efflux system membrane fusion protein